MQAARPVYIALGGNLPFDGGAPQDTLRRALHLLADDVLAVRAVSTFWHSPAWPDPSKPGYVNAVAEIDTALTPLALLDRLLAVEARCGRVREARWDSRTLDLDLIDHGGKVLDTERLQLPHPRATQRAFVLLPLQEVAPHWRDPVSGQAISDLVAALPEADRAAMHRLPG